MAFKYKFYLQRAGRALALSLPVSLLILLGLEANIWLAMRIHPRPVFWGVLLLTLVGTYWFQYPIWGLLLGDGGVLLAIFLGKGPTLLYIVRDLFLPHTPIAFVVPWAVFLAWTIVGLTGYFLWVDYGPN